MDSSVFAKPVRFGAIELANPVVMAPLTRLRNSPKGVPGALAASYYAQRASAGLIISEATVIRPDGVGYPCSPGIWLPEQVRAWSEITEAVHQAGGKIVLQLWHVGRISNSSLQPGQGLPIAPSAIAAEGMGMTADWKSEPFPVPRALPIEEIPQLVADYAQAARNAKLAGFDGVEVHGANGYLPDQFLQDGSNRREDAYGGPITNRARLLLEFVDAAIGVWGNDRVGVRLSPYGTLNGMADSDPIALFRHVIGELDTRSIAYLHLVEPRTGSPGARDEHIDAPLTRQVFRPFFHGPLLSAGGYDRADALAALSDGNVDAVAFGRHMIANPDLPERLLIDAPLNPYDRRTFYGGGAEGYTDYPTLDQVVA